MTILDDIKKYKNEGYFKKSIIPLTECKHIINELNNIKTNMKIPHTNIQFGYGNIINHDLAQYIINNEYIKCFCHNLYGDKYYYNSLYVHNKHRWVGPDVEWHQEVFNIKTFHPTNKEYDIEELKSSFMQIYVALEDQTLENGCMKIIPYQDSILEHYDTTNTHLNHKRAIKPEELDKIYNKFGIINLELNAGDVLFFNHLIPHSSSSNNGPFDRKAMVFLIFKDNDKFDESIRSDEKEYRKNFALNYLNDVLSLKCSKPMYECGNQSKQCVKNKNYEYEKLNIRKNNLLTNEDSMEHLYTIKDFPVSLSCVDPDLEHDKKIDMIFEICKKTGIIQIREGPCLEDIYIESHNTSYGKVWYNLFDLFSNMLNNYINDNAKIIEIGAGALLLSSKILRNDKIDKYTIYEKNLISNFNIDKRIKIFNEYFTNDTQVGEKYDIYIHSHVLEHVWNPKEFIESINRVSTKDNYHCFIVPNLKETFSNKYTNALDFEHNFFIIEDYIDIILHNNNFEILEKKFYLDHSIIYMTKKIEKKIIIKEFPNLYEINKQIAIDFYNYHQDTIIKLNKIIDNFEGELYLFGGTGFSIYLIKFGLKIDRIINILDNDPEKENKKVYGTNLIVKNPRIITDKKRVGVIVKAASYQEEIESQLIQLNNKVLIFK